MSAKHRILSATFYKWKGKYGSELKKLLAEAVLDNAMLKDVASKKW